MQIRQRQRVQDRVAPQTSWLPLWGQAGVVASFIVILVGVVLFTWSQPSHTLDSTDTQTRLAALMQTVPALNSGHVVYRARDNDGHTMDTAKIIADPRYPAGGGYIAVYHSQWQGGHSIDPGRHYYVFVAFSVNLLDWQEEAILGADASQPTIITVSNGGFLVAWEQTDANGHGNHVKLRYYASLNDLFTARWSRQFDTPTPSQATLARGATLSACAEGTPNIYTARLHPDIDHATITLGGHYNADCSIDRQMNGVLTLSGSWRRPGVRWQETRDTRLDTAILAWTARYDPTAQGGNIGDRDMALINGYEFGLFEGQYTKSAFGSFRCFLYDYQSGKAIPLNIVTQMDSRAFGNPTMTNLIAPNGQPAIVVTLYIFGEDSGFHESGELIYFQPYSSHMFNK